MSLTIQSARDPEWANPEKTMINIYVVFVEYKDSFGELPFAASPDDVEAHGRKLFENAISGEYGPIAPYKASESAMQGQVQLLTNEATTKINEIQQTVDTLQDAIDLEEATPEEIARLPVEKERLKKWKKYRIDLSRVPAQEGFPTTITWPVKPEPN